MVCVEPAMQPVGVMSQPPPISDARPWTAPTMTLAATTRRTSLAARVVPLARAARASTARRWSCGLRRNVRAVRLDAYWPWAPRAPRAPNARAGHVRPRQPVHRSVAPRPALLPAAPARAAAVAASTAKGPGPNALGLFRGRARAGSSKSRSAAMAATPRLGCAPSSARRARSARPRSNASPERAPSTSPAPVAAAIQDARQQAASAGRMARVCVPRISKMSRESAWPPTERPVSSRLIVHPGLVCRR